MLTCTESDGVVRVESDRIEAEVRTTGYTSGIGAQSFLDKATGVRDPGFGLHIMDFLLAPGWAADEYGRDRMRHGDLPKHFVEGPQICTQARALEHSVICGDGFVAVKQWFTFHEAGAGYVPGSRWEQTLLFLPGKRHVLSCEAITSVNSVSDLFYRIDMPGHVKHCEGDVFRRMYLSYHGIVPAEEFLEDFAPDERFFYVRDDTAAPERFIRAYDLCGAPGERTVWLAGMTLDPAAPCEAWCHQRGYVCFIQENHRRAVEKGETFGAAYVVGYFDSIEEMNAVYDEYRGARSIRVEAGGYELLTEVPQG